MASSTLTLSGFTLLLKSCEADKFCLFCLVQFSVSPQLFLWVCARVCVCSIQLTSNYSGSKSDHFSRFWVIAQPQWHGTKRARLPFTPQNITAGPVNSIAYALFAWEPGRILGCLFFLQSSFRKRILRECVMEWLIYSVSVSVYEPIFIPRENRWSSDNK